MADMCDTNMVNAQHFSRKERSFGPLLTFFLYLNIVLRYCPIEFRVQEYVFLRPLTDQVLSGWREP